MSKLPSYYAPPVLEEWMGPMAQEMHLHGWSYDFAIRALANLSGSPETRDMPRYMIALDRSVVRLWGKPLLHKGGKP